MEWIVSDRTDVQDSLGLSDLHTWVLSVGVGVSARSRLKGHGADRAFVEDLTVGALGM